MREAGRQITASKAEHAHQVAVVRIEELMSAAPGSPEGDELDILATLVDAYEARHHAIDAPDPIVVLQFRIEQQHFSSNDREPDSSGPSL